MGSSSPDRGRDLPGKRELTGYLRQAMQLIEDGVKRPANRGARPKAPVEARTTWWWR
jgi:hypothetical protein